MSSQHARTKASLRELHRAWVGELVRLTGLSPSRLATGAGLSDTTLSRLVNDPEYPGTLSPLSIQRLVERYEVPSPDHYTPGTPLVPPEHDAEPLADRNGTIEEIVETLANKSDAIEHFTLRKRTLDALGYMPGDILFVDTARRPQPGDVVLAVLVERDREPEQIFRLYEPPYLVTASLTPATRRPLLVDNESVTVRGVVVGSARVGKRE